MEERKKEGKKEKREVGGKIKGGMDKISLVPSLYM